MDLFDNSMVQSARKEMADEQLKEYILSGEYMYNNKSYSTKYTPKQLDKTDELKRLLQSGLLEEDMSEEEKLLLKES